MSKSIKNYLRQRLLIGAIAGSEASEDAVHSAALQSLFGHKLLPVLTGADSAKLNTLSSSKTVPLFDRSGQQLLDDDGKPRTALVRADSVGALEAISNVGAALTEINRDTPQQAQLKDGSNPPLKIRTTADGVKKLAIAYEDFPESKNAMLDAGDSTQLEVRAKKDADLPAFMSRLKALSEAEKGLQEFKTSFPSEETLDAGGTQLRVRPRKDADLGAFNLRLSALANAEKKFKELNSEFPPANETTLVAGDAKLDIRAREGHDFVAFMSRLKVLDEAEKGLQEFSTNYPEEKTLDVGGTQLLVRPQKDADLDAFNDRVNKLTAAEESLSDLQPRTVVLSESGSISGIDPPPTSEFRILPDSEARMIAEIEAVGEDKAKMKKFINALKDSLTT